MTRAHDSKRPQQSDLDFGVDRALGKQRSAGRSLLTIFLRWLPVMVALSLLAQVGIRGLKPALAERRNLNEKAAEVEDRYFDTLERQQELELRLEAQSDPIYRERLERIERRKFVEGQDAR